MISFHVVNFWETESPGVAVLVGCSTYPVALVEVVETPLFTFKKGCFFTHEILIGVSYYTWSLHIHNFDAQVHDMTKS